MATKDELIRLDDQNTDAWNRHDVDAFLNTLADDFTVIDDAEPQPIRSRDEFRRYAESWFTAFPDMRMDVRNRVVGDDAVAGEVEFTGTNTGPLEVGGSRVQPTGRKITGKGTYFMTIEADKIKELHFHADTLGMMTQLGLAGARG